MIRAFALGLVLCCLAAPTWAQGQPAQSASPAVRTVTKKPPRSRPKARPTAALTNDGPCRLGVIPAVGDQFVVDKFGLTVFGNEHDEVVTNWGLDDLIFARVRAAAGTALPVRRITYSPGAFEPFYHPRSRFLPDPHEGLSAIVQGFTGNAGCERYLVSSAILRERTRALVAATVDRLLPGYLKEE